MLSEGIQIIHYQKHWICVSTIGCQPGHVNIYDSLYSTLSPSAIQQICNLLHTKEAKLIVRMRDMQMQHGISECGLFSIACVVCLCQGDEIFLDTKTDVPTSNQLVVHSRMSFSWQLTQRFRPRSNRLFTSLSFALDACLKTKSVWSSARMVP